MKNMIWNIYKGFFAIFLDMKNYDLKHIQRVFCNISWHEKLWFETYAKGFSHGKNGPNLPDFKDFFFFLNWHF
jgi:hypothetical protein